LKGETSEILLCEVGDRLCALRLHHVIETMRVLPLEPLEGSLPCISGLSVIRGRACPVLDLAKLLGGRQVARRLVLLRVSDQTERQVALAVSAVQGIARLDDASWAELPPLLAGAAEDAVAAVAAHDAKLVMLLRTAALVNESSWAALEAR
jgi:purine-binding chemotaxis protein CheW